MVFANYLEVYVKFSGYIEHSLLIFRRILYHWYSEKIVNPDHLVSNETNIVAIRTVTVIFQKCEDFVYTGNLSEVF